MTVIEILIIVGAGVLHDFPVRGRQGNDVAGCPGFRVELRIA